MYMSLGGQRVVDIKPQNENDGNHDLQLFFAQRLAELLRYPSQILYVDFPPAFIIKQPESSLDLFHRVTREDMSSH